MKLLRISVNAFGGINFNSPVIIDWTKGKWVIADGDMGVGKTSLLNAVLVASGQLSRDTKDGAFVNVDSGKIDIDLDFVGNDRCTYHVRCTKSAFTLKYEGESVPEPITKMKELLGVVGISPMTIKNSPVKDIVKWLASYTKRSPEEFDSEVTKIKNAIETARRGRADANRPLKALNETLNSEPMVQDWENSEKLYGQPVSTTDLAATMEAARLLSEKLDKGEKKVVELVERKAAIVAELQKLQAELVAVDNSILMCNTYISEHKQDHGNYLEAKREYEQSAQKAVNHSKWMDLKKKTVERDQFETLSQQFDAVEKAKLKDLAKLQTEVLPDIKGVELVLEDTHQDGQPKAAGLYIDGISSVQVSESEWWKFVIQLWRKNKVKLVIVDNFQSLGSQAVEVLQKLHKDGAYILAAEMNRQQKTLEISYK